jgi:hypothetical protein
MRMLSSLLWNSARRATALAVVALATLTPFQVARANATYSSLGVLDDGLADFRTISRLAINIESGAPFLDSHLFQDALRTPAAIMDLPGDFLLRTVTNQSAFDAPVALAGLDRNRMNTLVARVSGFDDGTVILGPPPVVTVPEPTTGLLVLLALVAVMRARVFT